MSRAGDRCFRFDCAGHWAAGARAGFAAEGGALVAEPPLVARRIAGTAAGAVAAVGPCGRLTWLQPESGEIFVLHDFGAEALGPIGARDGQAIHSDPSVLWVRSGEGLRRYAAHSLQELGELRVRGLAASAPDGCGGLWLLIHDGTETWVRWLGRDGRLRDRPIRLDDVRSPIAIAADPARRRLAILDVPPGPEGMDREWALHLVDLAGCSVRKPLRFPLDREDPSPASIAADEEGGFRLVSAGASVLLIGVSESGVESMRQRILLPASAAAKGLLWLDGPVLDCADGLYRLVAAGEDDQDVDPVEATLITPTLISPPGTPSGWNRAEIEIDLPAAATLTATIFASSAESLARDVREALADTDRPAAHRQALERLLAGNRAVRVRTQSYAGTAAGQGVGNRTLHLLLDGIADPFLWLKLVLSCPPGAGRTRLASLKVRYPDQGWMDDLPAIYREEPGSAAELRRFLAPFEALYGGIDEAIDGLPGRIHPDTAPDDRLGWLLGWLGFPPTAGLPARVQRDLLKNAGGLLETRGTVEALQRMLEIVTGGRVSVDDGGGAAGFWVIGDGAGRLSQRLGRDTLALSRLPLGFRPGNGLRLGEERLAPVCSDLGRMLGEGCAKVSIRIAMDPARRAVLGPIVDSLLAMFVPAHCAIDLRVAPAGRTPPGGRLDHGWHLAGEAGAGAGERLADPDSTELGCETEAGTWRLPAPDPPPFTTIADAAPDGVRRLA